jgi:hypothetical protein
MFSDNFFVGLDEKIFRENFFENISTKIFANCFVNFFRNFFFANTFRNVFRPKLTSIEFNLSPSMPLVFFNIRRFKCLKRRILFFSVYLKSKILRCFDFYFDIIYLYNIINLILIHFISKVFKISITNLKILAKKNNFQKKILE